MPGTTVRRRALSLGNIFQLSDFDGGVRRPEADMPKENSFDAEASLLDFSQAQRSGGCNSSSQSALKTERSETAVMFVPTFADHSSSQISASALHLPPLPVATILLGVYFEQCHPRQPILHQETFLRTFSVTGSSQPSVLVLTALFAMACTFLPLSGISLDSVPSPYNSTHYFYCFAKDMLRTSEIMDGPPEVETVIALWIMASLVGCVEGDMSWMRSRYLSRALGKPISLFSPARELHEIYVTPSPALALELRMHTELPNEPNNHESPLYVSSLFQTTHRLEREIRRRIWWTLWEESNLSSGIAHLPSTTPTASRLLRLPCPDYFFDTPSLASSTQPAPPQLLPYTHNIGSLPMKRDGDVYAQEFSLAELVGKIGAVKGTFYDADLHRMALLTQSGSDGSETRVEDVAVSAKSWGEGWEPGGQLSQLDETLVLLHARLPHPLPYARGVLPFWSRPDSTPGSPPTLAHALLHLTASSARVLLHRPVDLTIAHRDTSWISHPCFPVAVAEAVRAGEIAQAVLVGAADGGNKQGVPPMGPYAAYWALQAVVIALVPMRVLISTGAGNAPLLPSMLVALVSTPPRSGSPLLRWWPALAPRILCLPEVLTSLVRLAESSSPGNLTIASAVAAVRDVLMQMGLEIPLNGDHTTTDHISDQRSCAHPFSCFISWAYILSKELSLLVSVPPHIHSRTPTRTASGGVGTAIPHLRSPTGSSADGAAKSVGTPMSKSPLVIDGNGVVLGESADIWTQVGFTDALEVSTKTFPHDVFHTTYGAQGGPLLSTTPGFFSRVEQHVLGALNGYTAVNAEPNDVGGWTGNSRRKEL
ncbi:hypothetical protein HDU93_000903 [Gonapodya sp. JEL0774]|nr:hypothetical protein HDU93_000903 [Gonapodya sp. JEL0774]